MAKRLIVFLIEDDPGDIRLISEAINHENLDIELLIRQDGENALAFLHNSAESHPDQLPQLILLDLNLPKISGLDILKVIKSNKILQQIPVLILTTSDNKTDIEETYGNGANSYIIKPSGLQLFRETLHSIIHFWMEIVELPERRK